MIYLDNAATSHPKPEAVHQKMNWALQTCASPGRSGHKMAIEADRVIFTARETIARLFNIPQADRIIFTPNATAAINLAIQGLVAPGDHVITTSMEHNSVIRPLWSLAQAGVSVQKISATSEGIIEPQKIAAAINSKTKLIAITHASNVIGTITPVAEIVKLAHEHGVPVLVDASQTAGLLPIDVSDLGVDMLACPGHKGLLGPQGTGFLYIAPHLQLKPLAYGGTGSRSDVEEMPDFLPDRFEPGTLNTPGIAGLGAAAEFLLSQSLEHVRNHEIMLCQRLLDSLSAIKGVSVYGLKDCTKRTAVIAFNVDSADPATVGDRLDEEFGIAVRLGLHCAPDAHKTIGTYPKGTVRMSPGFFNTAGDIDKAIEAVGKIARECLRNDKAGSSMRPS